jgi:hypothetical protein
MTGIWTSFINLFSGLRGFFINTLGPWQWALLLCIPPAIIALYFLKLKRQPLEVPSTYLWQRTIEDLHVNSLWQRLRKSILLLLQLLLLLLLILAVLRPGWRGATLQGDRFIFLIDNSASMTATDVEPTRLDETKRRVTEMIGQMKSGDVAMVVSFSDRARIEARFTDNRRVLRQAVDSIQATNRTSDLGEALRLAAPLANPGRTSQDAGDVQWAEAREAAVYIFTDGGFGRVTGFSKGNLEPTYVPIGEDTARNVGITAFSTQRNIERPEQLQAYARIENYTDQDLNLAMTLELDDDWHDTTKVEIPAGKSGGIEFELEDVESGTLKLILEDKDDFAADNVAYTSVNTPRRARVLLITPKNDALTLSLSTDRALKLADVLTATPKILESKEHDKKAQAGGFDLIIYDQCAPQRLPQCSTMFVGSLPPGDAWSAGDEVDIPQIIDTERTHPIMRYVDLGNVRIASSRVLDPPPGSSTLIEAELGPICAIAPREGFEDCVLGFEIVGQDEDGQRYANTDWVRRYSFPLFMHNVLEYLGGAHGGAASATVQPGRPITLRAVTPAERIQVVDPKGVKHEIGRQGQAGFIYGYTDRQGAYEVVEGKTVTQRFTVNLFDPVESDIVPKPVIYGEYEEIPARAGWLPMRRELWRWIVVAALILLALEWYIYNRRVYL